MMKILLVDDHAILLDGIANLIEKSANELIERANTVDEALNYFTEAEYDILITDFNLIDENGLNLLRKVKNIYPNLKIIVLSMHDEASLVHEIIKDGVRGEVLKTDSHQDLVEAIESANKNKAYLNEEISNILHTALNQNNEERLFTKREKEVLNYLAQNFSEEQIAEEIDTTLKSVQKTHKAIFKKTKTSSTEGLLKFAYANNLI